MFSLLLFIFDRYEYQDYDVQNCSSDKIFFSVQLVGNFSESSPVRRGNPYHMRLEMKNPEHDLVKNVISVQAQLILQDNSKRRPLVLPKDKLFKKGIFLIENISIPYDNYLLNGLFISETASGIKIKSQFKCDVTKKPSSEYRATLIDNLLSA